MPTGRPFDEVLRAALRLVAPDRDVEVVRLVDPLPGLVLAPGVDGDPQLADRRAAAGGPELWVLGQVPDQDDAVDVRHARPPPPASPPTPPTPSAQRTPRAPRRLRRFRSRRPRPRLARPGPARPGRRGLGRRGLGQRGLGRLGLRGRSLVAALLALVARALLDGRERRRRGAASALDATGRHVAHDAVGDLQDAGDLVERRRLRVELEQVVRAVRLVVDLVGEPPSTPHVVREPRAVALLDQLVRARHDLGLALLGQLRIEHQ